MGARSAAASVVRHVGGVAAEATLVAALVATVALALSPVYAPAKFVADTGAARAAGSVQISVPNGVYAGTDVATIDPASGTIWVDARCYQGGSLVYEQWAAADSSLQATLTLGPTPAWTGGAASCTATANALQRSGRFKLLASTTFSVSG